MNNAIIRPMPSPTGNNRNKVYVLQGNVPTSMAFDGFGTTADNLIEWAKDNNISSADMAYIGERFLGASNMRNNPRYSPGVFAFDEETTQKNPDEVIELICNAIVQSKFPPEAVQRLIQRLQLHMQELGKDQRGGQASPLGGPSGGQNLSDEDHWRPGRNAWQDTGRGRDTSYIPPTAMRSDKVDSSSNVTLSGKSGPAMQQAHDVKDEIMALLDRIGHA